MMRTMILILSLGLFQCVELSAREIHPSQVGKMTKSQVLDWNQFDGNQIRCDMESNGMLVSHRITGHSGLEWPIESEQYAVYTSGMWYLGKVNGQVRSCVAEYGPEGLKGPYGSDPASGEYRIYKVNKTDLIDPTANPDFQQWPVDQGAPWVDVDDDGIYTPLPEGYDHPEFIGDQVIYYVYNDADEDAHSIFNTLPLGLEVRVTIWGYKHPLLENVMFIKEQFFNKGGQDVTDMYVSLWSDPDIGNAGDDYVGCDPARNVGYAYNDGPDYTYGEAVPAVGYNLLQIAVPSRDASDEHFCFDELKQGYQNLPMSSFFKYIGSDDVYTDPNDALEAYYYVQGLKRDGNPITDPTTGLTTPFVANGDPLLNLNAGDDIWVDGDDNPSDDRRMLLSSGPFDLAAGDSGEVVIALIIGRGSSALNSIVEMRRISDNTAALFANGLQVPPAPPKPEVSVTKSPNEILLRWDDRSEGSSPPGEFAYAFEGYNVYQHSSADSLSEKIRIATFDLKNDLEKIWDHVYHPDVGEYIYEPVRFGSNSGVQRYFRITEDAFDPGASLIDDREYYFSVRAYGYLDGLRPNTLESQQEILAVRPQLNLDEEPTHQVGSESIAVTHIGTADASLAIDIIDPFALQDEDYEVYFTQQHYYRDIDDRWIETNYPDSVGRISKSGDVSHSEIFGACLIYGVSPGTYDLGFTVDFQSNGAYADGLFLDLPDDLSVNSWTPITGRYNSWGAAQGQNDANGDGTLSAGNVLTWGDNSRSGFGAIEGNVMVSVNINETLFPFVINYTLWDDGSTNVDEDATGTISISEIGYEFMTIPHWNLKNGGGEILLSGQTILGDEQLPYVDTHGILHDRTEVGEKYTPVIDGFQVRIRGDFDLPVQERRISHLGMGQYHWDSYNTYGWAATSRAIDTWGMGTEDINQLEADYEIRWTGVYDTPVDVNGDGSLIYHPISPGTGSLATWVGASPYEASDHPMNPDGLPYFQVRIPFEVWNMDSEEQVSCIIYDRIQNPTEGGDFYAFNPDDRMYIHLWNEPYDESVIYDDQNGLDNGQNNGDHLTWNIISWEADWRTGDVLHVEYDNPLKAGGDVFTFTTTAPTQLDYDPGLIKVWPNPYFAQNPEEQASYLNQIHFINLPETATIRIFNLAGQLVRVLEHTSGQEHIWDVRNSHNLNLASGVYLAIVESEYETQVLKLALVSRKIW